MPTAPLVRLSYMSTLAERIQEALDDTGAIAADLARACGVKPPSVSAWLSGDTKSLDAHAPGSPANPPQRNEQHGPQADPPQNLVHSGSSLGLRPRSRFPDRLPVSGVGSLLHEKLGMPIDATFRRA